MPKRSRLPALSKLSRPRLFGAVARERLFARLDEARDLHPGICVVGPPGAGKTTLVASWLEARKRGGIWYQVDAGDADPATFFHYLGQAAQPHARRGQRPLPALTPEYLPDVHGFSRRCFRELFSRLPPKSALVLDNYQEVEADHLLHELVSAAVDEVPPGSHLIVVSRADPPACYARLKANRSVTLLDWNDLRLTLDEALAIGHLQRAPDDAALSALHERCDGWAAGLILMLAERHGNGTSGMPARDAPEAVFDYFAGTLFDRASPELRHMLLSVAFLPYVRTEWAVEASGNAEAGALLEQLYRRHFFTQRRPEADGSYQFHALFQGFLQARARRHFTEEAYEDLLQLTADVLRESGEVEAAFDLYCESANWPCAADALLDAAERMVAAGRSDTMIRCILRLPAGECIDRPWLIHWHAVATTPSDPDSARRLHEEAHLAFSRSGDRCAQACSIAGVLDTFSLGLTDMAGARPWVVKLLDILHGGIEYASVDTELRVLTALLYPCGQLDPNNALAAEMAERAMQLASEARDANLALWAANGVLVFAQLTGRVPLADRATVFARGICDAPVIAPLTAAVTIRAVGYWRYVKNDIPDAIACYQRASAIARVHGFRQIEFATRVLQGHAEWRLGDFAAARESLRVLDVICPERPPHLDCLHGVLRAQIDWTEGERDEAIQRVKRALSQAESSGFRSTAVACELILIDWLLEQRQWDEAAVHVRLMEDQIETGRLAAAYWPPVGVNRFLLSSTRGDPVEARALAGRVLDRSREQGVLVYLRWVWTATTRLCAHAIEHDIHADHARALIRAYGLRAPEPDLEYWPWLAKVRTFGGFELVVDGHGPVAPRKAPRRLFQLLKALVAFGAFDVPAQALVDALWSDEDGDSGLHSLQVSITRLRKLLGDPDAVRVHDGRVSLNRDLCWVDALVFDRMTDVNQSWSIDVAERACTLYPGAFLSDEGDAAWAVPARERLRTRYVAQVERIGDHHEAAAQWDRAASWYQRGIEADPLMESFHRGVIRCYARAGRKAEAIGAYRRLRHTLSVVLGIEPSPVTRALYDALYADGASVFDP